MKDAKKIKFGESRKSETEGLIKDGTFIPWDRRKIP